MCSGGGGCERGHHCDFLLPDSVNETKLVIIYIDQVSSEMGGWEVEYNKTNRTSCC